MSVFWAHILDCIFPFNTEKGNADLQTVMGKVKSVTGEQEPGYLRLFVGSIIMLHHWP